MPIDMRSDRSLGLEAAFLHHRTRLLRFLVTHGAGEAAEDLLQELWFKIDASTDEIVGQPLRYLYRMANNLMIDRARSRRQAEQRDLDWTDVSSGTVAALDVPTLERAAIAGDLLFRVQTAIDALGSRPAAILRRYRIDGIPQREIAREFGVSLSTVESDLRKGYAALIAFQDSLDDPDTSSHDV